MTGGKGEVDSGVGLAQDTQRALGWPCGEQRASMCGPRGPCGLRLRNSASRNLFLRITCTNTQRYSLQHGSPLNFRENRTETLFAVEHSQGGIAGAIGEHEVSLHGWCEKSCEMVVNPKPAGAQSLVQEKSGVGGSARRCGNTCGEELGEPGRKASLL